MSGFKDLPEDVTVQIFQHLSFSAARSILPLVCKDWQQLVLSSPTLLGSITLSGSEERQTWQLLEKSAGRRPNASTFLHKSISMLTVAQWLRRNPVATSMTVPADANMLFEVQELSISLAPLLVSIHSTLRHLDLASIGWVGLEHCFTNLAHLENLESLRLGAVEDLEDKEELLIGTRDLEGLFALTSLKSLAMQVDIEEGWVRLDPFPASFFALTQLKRLEFGTADGCEDNIFAVEWDPDLRGFPKRLAMLSGLEELVLNSIFYQPSFADAALPASLTLLNLRYNALNSFFPAQQLHSLPALAVLDLECNRLTEIPDMSGLVSLQVLNCAWNHLAVLPVQKLLGLTAIVELNFSCQSLTAASRRYGTKGNVAMEVSEEVVELARLGQLRSLDVTPVGGVALPAKSLRAVRGLIEAVRGVRPSSRLFVRVAAKGKSLGV